MVTSSKLVVRRMALALGISALGAAGNVMAGAVIFNTGDAATATVALGVNDEGHLNTLDPTGATSTSNASGYFGVAAKFPDGTWRDATAPGCLCEGWGVSATAGSGAHSGYANISVDGVVNLTPDSFTTDAGPGTGTFATSAVHLTSLPGLAVTQEYRASTNAPGVLFTSHVTITNNTGADLTDVRYVRVMDWDIPPTEFSEAVTIRGTATTTFLETSHDDGFSTANPLGFTSPIDPATLDVDFVDNNPTSDHGAYFRFNFGTIADGASYDFDIFYGAAPTEADALAAIGAEGIELFSLGQHDGDVGGGTPRTYIFAFAGVGGDPVIPPPPASVPEPTTLALLGTGLLGLVTTRRVRRRKAGS